MFSTTGAGVVGNDRMEDSLVEADRVLPSHKVVNYLQHRAVERSGVVQTQNIALAVAAHQQSPEGRGIAAFPEKTRHAGEICGGEKF